MKVLWVVLGSYEGIRWHDAYDTKAEAEYEATQAIAHKNKAVRVRKYVPAPDSKGNDR